MNITLLSIEMKPPLVMVILSGLNPPEDRKIFMIKAGVAHKRDW
jgi:hypothetical protein